MCFSMQRFSISSKEFLSSKPDSKERRAALHSAGRSRLPTTSVRTRSSGFKERGSHQECLVPLRVVGHGAQVGETRGTLRRVALFQALLVGHGLLLHVLDVQRAALGLIGIQIDRLSAQRAIQELA